MEPDVVPENRIAGGDVAEVEDASLCTEVGWEGEFDDALLFLGEEDRVLGLTG